MMDVYFCFSFGRRESEPGLVNHEIATHVLLRLEQARKAGILVKPYIASQWEVSDALLGLDIATEVRVELPKGATYIDTHNVARVMVRELALHHDVTPYEMRAVVFAHPLHIERCMVNLRGFGVKKSELVPTDELYDEEDMHPHVRSRTAFLRREPIARACDRVRIMFAV